VRRPERTNGLDGGARREGGVRGKFITRTAVPNGQSGKAPQSRGEWGKNFGGWEPGKGSRMFPYY